MVEFDKSQKVPGKADQNLKEINFIIWRKFTAQGRSRISKGGRIDIRWRNEVLGVVNR